MTKTTAETKANIESRTLRKHKPSCQAFYPSLRLSLLSENHDREQTFGKEMKKLFIIAMLAASVGTAPALLILVLVDLLVVRLTNMPSLMMSLGFMSAPLFFPFVVIGTILSCHRSVMIRMRPLVITLGVLSVAATGLVSAYWCYILTHGFMG